MRAVLNQPGKHAMANGTTTRRAPQLLETRDLDKTLVTMNQAEARAVMRAAGARHENRLPRVLNARNLLITRGSRGWTLLMEGGAVESPAVRVPEHTDFIGCGDYAAAGALRAIIGNLDPRETINESISRKLELNIVEPPAPRDRRGPSGAALALITMGR